MKSPVLYMPRPMVAGSAFSCCLQVKNEHGEILSLALDNSAGASGYAWRGDLAMYAHDEAERATFTVPGPTPLDLLERLARHLGYRIERI